MPTQIAGLKMGDGLGDFMLFTTDARRNAAPANESRSSKRDDGEAGASAPETGTGGVHSGGSASGSR